MTFLGQGKGGGYKLISLRLHALIDQFQYIKIQPNTINLSTRLQGITTELMRFIPNSLVLRSIVLG